MVISLIIWDFTVRFYMIRLNGAGCRSILAFIYNEPRLIRVSRKDVKEYPTYFTIGNSTFVYPKLFFTLENKGLTSRVNFYIGAGGLDFILHMGVI